MLAAVGSNRLARPV